MKIEHYPLDKLKKEILGIVHRYLDTRSFKVFFFGSRINGKADERSDIDIGIEGPDTVSIEVMAQIKGDISNLPTLYHIDIVDFKSVDKDFYKVAKQNFELIIAK